MGLFDHVQPGSPLNIRASTWNKVMDAAAAAEAPSLAAPAVHLPAERVLVRNDSGAAQDRFAVLGIDAPLFLPADDEQAFKTRVALKGIIPTFAAHKGRFVILQEPVAIGKIAVGLLSGVTPVKVNIQTAGDKFADVADGVAANLKSGSIGSAQILWKESGTGVKWAVVRLSNRPCAAFPVKVVKDDGVSGGAAANCTWTYTVKDLAGNTLGATVAPQRARYANTIYTFAPNDSYGLAAYDGATLKLLVCFGEIEQTDVCP